MKILKENPEDEIEENGGSRDSKIAVGAASIVGNLFRGCSCLARNARRFFLQIEDDSINFRHKLESNAAVSVAQFQRCATNNGGRKGDAVLVGDSGLHFPSKWKMTSVWKRLQRVGKKASKFQFTALYQSLTVECVRGGKWWVCIKLELSVR